MSRPADQIGNVLGLLIEHYFASYDLVLDILGDILKQLLVDLRGLGLEHKGLILKYG